MAKTELEIIIDKNGEVHLDIKGIKGKGCLAIAEIVKQILGQMKNKQLKPEYYEDEVVIRPQIDVEQKE